MMLTRVGPRNHVLDGVPDPPKERGNFWGLSDPLKSIGSLCCSVRKNGRTDRDVTEFRLTLTIVCNQVPSVWAGQ